jgi:hypothetical protein
LTISATSAQHKEIIGIFTSAMDGKPIKNVKIFVKGTSLFTKTNKFGEYKITVPNEQAVLIYRTKMETKELEVGQQTTIDISIAKDLVCQRRWPFRLFK